MKKPLRSLFLFSLSLTPLAFANQATPQNADTDGEPHSRVDNGGVTAQDQLKGSPQDMELTRRIRQELVKRSDLSIAAQNIKIITQGGRVTLKGPVRSDEEKTTVASIAQKLAGEKKVRNRLNVEY